METRTRGEVTPTRGDAVDAGEVAPVDRRILDATLRCIAEHGVSCLTLDDVARSAECGRATVYRTFPGGKAGVIEAAVQAEIERFTIEVGARLDAADTLEDLLVAALVGAARFVRASAPLGYLMANEPSIVLAHMSFDQSRVVFDAADRLLGPRLRRFLAPEDVPLVAEWLARVGLSYVALPRPGVDLADAPTARHVVSSFILPGLRPPRPGSGADRPPCPADPSRPADPSPPPDPGARHVNH